MKYRPEIDGLRAIAVLLVVLYHARFSIHQEGFFLQGGFIGVDMFFVLSGYLISKIILKEIYSDGTFNFAAFFTKRIKRILPILYTTILTSAFFAWFLLQPADLADFGKSAASSIFFVSNFFFFLSTTEYGARDSLTEPLLHTWSLSVEEQFYLLFPLFIYLIYRKGKGFILPFLIFSFLLSILFASYASRVNVDLNFYLPFSRFWELLFGSLIAKAELENKFSRTQFAATVFPIFGLFLMGVSLQFFDGNTRHPSFITLLPVCATAMIVCYSSKDFGLGKVLSLKAFVGLGQISYSLYLWHFPVFAFSRIHFGESLNEQNKISLIFFSIFISILSFFLIEKPFRYKFQDKLVLKLLFILTAVILLFSYYFIKQGGAGHQSRTGEFYQFDNSLLKKERQNYSKKLFTKERLGPKESFDSTNILVVGNSHGEQMAIALRQLYSDDADIYVHWVRYQRILSTNGYVQLSCFDPTLNGNPIEKKFYSSKAYDEADLILVSTRYNPESRDRDLMYCESGKPDAKGSDFAGLSSIIEQAIKDNKQIRVISNTMEFMTKDSKPISDSIVEQTLDPYEINAQMYEFMKPEVVTINEEVERIAKSYNVAYWDLTKTICDFKDKLCFGVDGLGRKNFYDYGHFTIDGAKFFSEKLKQQRFSLWLESDIYTP